MDELPKEATHFFTNVDFAVIPEIDYQKLEELSQLAQANSSAEKYLDLRESLIKLMWAKVSGLRANSIETELLNQYEPQVLVQEYIGQIEHEKSIFEFITHTKSSLDAMATFLNQYFQIGESGGNIDFKRSKFRNKLTEKESSFQKVLDKLNIWLQENRGKSDSIISIRDFWIHQSTPWIQLLWPPTSMGVLPIPKKFRKIRP
ncbi:hypothetical protein QQ054_03510 [Oscillatoria amoena NRMC-F 0135]|nr:hypothetical protein [Oscillatoria amoena NRMC-F 0135]